MKIINRLIAVLMVSTMLLWSFPSQATISFTISNRVGPFALGQNRMSAGTLDLASTYVTGGFTVTASDFGLSTIQNVLIQGEDGYSFFWNPTTSKIMVFSGAGATSSADSAGTPAGTNGTSSVTGTGTFVGTSSGSLNLATPAFSGTGFATAGQVVTTTDNQTMTLNEAAGMWLIADALTSTAPVLIASNTAVTGAPAVLTVIGTAPATDAGTYKIVKNIIPTGSVTALSGTAAAQTFTGSALATHTHTIAAGAGAEIANGTSLASVDQVNFVVIGW